MWCRREGRVRQGLPEKVTFEKKHVNEGVICILGEKCSKVGGTACAKAQKQKCAWRNSEEASVVGTK